MGRLYGLAHDGDHDEALAAAVEGAASPDDHVRSVAQLCFFYIALAHGRLDFDVAMPAIKAGLQDASSYVVGSAQNAVRELEWHLPDFAREDFGIPPPQMDTERARLAYLAHSRRHYEESLALTVRLAASSDTEDREGAMLHVGTIARQYGRLDATIAGPILMAGLDDPDENIRGAAALSVYSIVDALPAFPGLNELLARIPDDDVDEPA